MSETKTYSLSFQQEQVFINCGFKAVQCELQFNDLDEACFWKVMRKIVQKNEILRTIYTFRQSDPLPIPKTQDSFSANRVDLSEKIIDSKKVLESLRMKEKEKVVYGPLRCTVVKLSPSQFYVILTLPNLSADKRTLYRLVNLIHTTYDDDELIDEDFVQYQEFSTWQRENCTIEHAELPKSFNSIDKKTFKNFPFKNSVCPDIVNLNHFHEKIPHKLFNKIIEFCNTKESTLESFFLTCFYGMFSTLCMEDNFEILLGVDGRNSKELHNTLGLFARGVPFRCTANDQLSFYELLETVKRELKLVRDWQDYYKQDSNQFSYSIGFSYEEFSYYNKMSMIHDYQDELNSTVNDISLHIISKKNEACFQFSYNEALYTRESINILMQQLLALCEKVCLNPNRSIKENSVLPKTLSFVINDWCTNTHKPDDFIKVHEEFEIRAKETQNSVAVDDGNSIITYEELNIRANQLSASLKKLGVGTNDVIAVYMEKSIESVVSLLGILKSGAAFLPLDSNDPLKRIQSILSDSMPKMVITTKSFIDSEMFRQNKYEEPINLFNQLFVIKNKLYAEINETNLAYVIYTSGSTGQPKGVMISHQSLSNHLFWAKQLMNEPVEYLPLITRISFDMSMKQLFVPLILGKPVWIIPEKEVFDIPTFLNKLIRRKNVGLNCVPSLWKKIVDYLEQNTYICKSMTIIEITFGGERLDEQLVKRTWSLLPSVKINNFYGPSETTCNATGGAILPNETVTIGKPAFNYDVYILNNHLHPVSIGVTGEICIGGRGLANGYLHNETLTKKKFVKAANLGNQLVYKTGDIGRVRSDGRIECLDRFDHQVKVRGFRIEIGEVEKSLEQYPKIIEAAVKLLQNEDKDSELVAYVVTNENLSLDDIRNFLKSILPNYMIPSTYVCLSDLPKSSSGKVDRKGLPNPDIFNNLTNQTKTLPRNQVEETLLSIYKKLLNLEQLEVDKSFFELGGHSLLATQLIAQIWDTFEVEISLSFLYEGATIMDLGEKIETLLYTESSSIPTFSHVSRYDKIPATLNQKNLWLLESELGDTPFLKVLLPLQLKGKLNIKTLKKSINDLIKYHEPLRTSFYEEDGELYQSIYEHEHEHQMVQFDLSHLQQNAQKNKIRKLIMEDLERAFNLEDIGPILRSTLIKAKDDEYLLLFVLHHVNCDGVSLRILTEDLCKFYKHNLDLKNRKLEIKGLEVQYADYAVWEKSFLETDTSKRQLDYWLNKLGTNRANLNLPYDFPEPENRTYMQSAYEFNLENSLVKALNSFNKQNNVSMFVTLISALKSLLVQYAPENIVHIGTMFANRHRGQLSRAVGLFSNNVVLQTKIKSRQTFINLINDVRNNVIQAQHNSDVPFELVVDVLERQNNLDRSELCQVAFNYEVEPTIEVIEMLKIEQAKIMNSLENMIPTSFDIECNVSVINDTIQVQFQYSMDHFKSNTIENLAKNYLSFLKAAVNQPTIRLSDFFGGEKFD